MRAGGGKQKGNAMEREMAHLLEDLTGLKGWHRVGVSSGARGTTGISDSRYNGDVFLDVDEKNQDPQYKILANYFKNLVVECKIIGTKINLESVLSDKSILAEWIKQTEEESKGKDWVLLFRYFGSPTFACSDKPEVMEKLGLLEMEYASNGAYIRRGGNHLRLYTPEKIYFLVAIDLKGCMEKAEHAEVEAEGTRSGEGGHSVAGIQD